MIDIRLYNMLITELKLGPRSPTHGPLDRRSCCEKLEQYSWDDLYEGACS